MTTKLSLTKIAACLAVVFTSALNAQPFQIGHVTLTFTDSSRNRDIATEIYYPADVAGNNVEIASSGGVFPTLAFGHGFVMGYDAYENIWNSLIPQGFIVALPKTEGGILPSHLEFAKDLNFVLAQMTAQGQNPASIFFKRIGTETALGGHSMGGGAAILAAQLNPTVTGLVVLAPAETNPSAISAAATVSASALVIAGSNDCVTPTGTNQLPMYNALISSCKTYINIQGASHCQMAESNFLCSFGESTCSPSATISREEQHEIIDKYLLKWLQSKLKSDCTAGSLFDSEIISDSAISFEKNCLLCDPLSIAENNFKGMIFPNPFNENLNLDFDAGTVFEFVLYDLQSRKISSALFSGLIQIDTQNLSAGMYIYEIGRSGKTIKKGKLFKK